MAIKKFPFSWAAIYRKDINSYFETNSPIRAGSSRGYNTYLGMNSVAILNAIKTSKTPAKVWLNFHVTSPASGQGVMALGAHKETTNKGSGTMPYYTYTGRRFVPTAGWRRYDITDFGVSIPNGGNTFKSALEGGYHGLVLYGQVGETHTTASGIGTGYVPFIEVEGDWNTPPTSSNFIKPLAGQIFDNVVEVEWQESTDEETPSSELYYQFDFYNGTEWKYAFQQKNRTTANFYIDDKPETSRARIRMRVYDGELYSPYTYSNYFTINHNTPPSIPTLKKHIGGVAVDRTQPIELEWNHNDDDTQSKFNLRHRVRGTSPWAMITEKTSRQSKIFSANTFPIGIIEWQVQTYDQGDLESPWSTSGLFFATEAGDSPIIATPNVGESLTNSNLLLDWSSSGQQEYQVELYQGSTLIKSWTGTGNNKIVSEDSILQNETSYSARVRIKANGLWTSWSEVDFSTSFTTPSQPSLVLTQNLNKYAIVANVVNPYPAEGEPDTARNILERRKVGEEWIILSRDITNTGVYIDYTAAADTVYEYKVRAVGDNGTISEEVIEIASIDFDVSVISRADDPFDFLILDKVLERNRSIDYKSEKMMFSGRRYPVVEFSETVEDDVSISALVEKNELMKLSDMINGQETLLYRDARGKRVYAIVPGISITDEHLRCYTVSLDFERVDYKEGETYD